MAWIESHQDLERHPKVADLMSAMNWDLDATIGKLHRFWWWCVDYAEDGDLTRHNDSRIAQAMGVAIVDASRLKVAMIEACWLDREPYFRVHDWWDYIGRFLKVKYKDSPHKWQRIQELYGTDTVTGSATTPVTRTTERTDRPNQPNLTNRSNRDSLHPAIAVPGAKVVDLLSLCRELFGESEMHRFHKRWYDRAKSDPSKLTRVLAEVKSAVIEKRITTTPPKYAEDTWKRFK